MQIFGGFTLRSVVFNPRRNSVSFLKKETAVFTYIENIYTFPAQPVFALSL